MPQVSSYLETHWVPLPGDKECARESLAQFIREDVRRRWSRGGPHPL